jgi:hypothetical protein
MVVNAHLIVMVLSLVLLLMAALEVPKARSWTNYGWAGLFFWMLSNFIK